MRSLIVLIIVIGIIFIAIGYIQENSQCPPPKIIYKYLERNPTHDHPQSLLMSSYSMFHEPSAWEKLLGFHDNYRKQTLMNAAVPVLK